MLEKIKDIAGKKTIKMAALLALMSVGKATFAESKTDIGDGPRSEEVKHDVDERLESKEGTYTFSEADVTEMTKESRFELIRMDLDVSYEADKADLAEKYKEEVSAKFVNFLDNINKDNFDVANESDWQVFSSCDERKTNAWGKAGNEALAEARGESIIKELKEVLSNYEFEFLSEEYSKALKNKEIKNKIASEHSNRRGETLITDRMNPDTNKNYTDEEVQDMEKNNPDKYFELLSENRISEFRAEIPVERLNISPTESLLPNLEISNRTELVNKFSDFKNVILLLDSSTSMKNDKKKLSEEIDNQGDKLKNTNLFIGHYSNELKEIKKAENSEDTKLEIIKAIGSGSSQEFSVKAAIEAWNKVGSEIKSGEKTLISINTDEALQKVSLEDLEKLANLPSNVEVRFVFYLNGDKELEVSLGTVQNEFDIIKNKLNKKLEKQIEELQTKLNITESNLSKHQARHLQAPNRSVRREMEKRIRIEEKQQEIYISKISKMYEEFGDREDVTLDKFTDDNDKTTLLRTYH